MLDPASQPYNHVLLSTASRLSIPAPDDLQTSLGLTDMAMVGAHRQTIIEQLRAERRSLTVFPAKIIISSEHIHSRLREDNDLENVKSLLSPFCATFRVVVYLRSQHELAQSLAVTAIRTGKQDFRRIPDFATPTGLDEVLSVDARYFDYAVLLDRLARAFGAEALDVRLYAPDRRENADIITDFFSGLGLDISDLPQPPRQNTSFTEPAVLFLARLNKYAAGTPDAARLRHYVQDHLARHHAGQPPPAPAEDIARFMAQFAASNEAVRARWFPDRAQLFAPASQSPGRNRPPAALTEQDMFTLFQEILAELI